MSQLVAQNALPAVFASPSALADDLIEYFARPEEMQEEQVITNRDGSNETRMVTRFRPVPLLEEWCSMHRITRRRLEALAETHPDIADALEFARDVLKVYIVRKGLTEQYNGQFAKFVATNEVGMVDRSEQINKSLIVKGSDLLDEIEKAAKPIRR